MKTAYYAYAILLLMTTNACTCRTIEAGYMGVKVDLYGSDKGVDGEEVGPGRYWVGINERLYEFPVHEQNYVWTKDPQEGSPNDESFTFQTSEGLSVNADAGIKFTIERGKVDTIFQKYRKGVDELVDVVLRAQVRDAFNTYASQMPVEAVYGKGKMELLKKVQQRVQDAFTGSGIVVQNVFLIGDFRLPSEVRTALSAKVAATQRAQQRENELREAEAQAAKRVAEAKGQAEATLTQARATAEANRILARSLTPQLVEYERIKRWDGKLPQVSGGATPFINLDQASR